ncbi:MAG TPA: ABC transporter ATP-binding protein [Vicinamibacterales bacterium]|jgi:ABC-2 type transport system ATP-binding protein|nr:ABC transporter ATP-binding protein [Vicinamibacterales bacterium]
MAISVEHFGRTYTTSTGTVPAVDDLSFQVSAGEIVGLIGPNGAGKTTTLRALAGILKPTSGHVRIDGHDLIAEPIEAKRRLAFMPDEPHLFEYLTVAEHLRLIARLYTVEDFERRSRALLDELELTGKEDSLPGELSRGMRQKVVIACGLVRSATTLLFDEPLTGLDPLGIRRMRETIVSRAREGAAILLSSHLLHLVEEVCTRVMIMDRGRKVADGTFDELRARVELAQAGSSLEQIFLRVTGHDIPSGQP